MTTNSTPMHRAPDVYAVFIGHLENQDDALGALQEQFPDLHLRSFPTVAEAIGQMERDWERIQPACIPACVLTEEVGSVDDAISELAGSAPFAQSHFALVTRKSDHHDVGRSLDRGLLISVMSSPVKPEVLGRQQGTRVSEWARKYQPDAPWLDEFLTKWREYMPQRRIQFTEQLEMSSHSLARMLLRGIEEVLGPRPRLHIPANVDITKQGRPVRAVYLILEGSVALHQNADSGSAVLLHHASSGPLIGLVSFTTRSLAAFTSRTTTEVVAVRITMEQLDRVMEAQPAISALLAMVSLRALADRLVRAEQLHFEKERLAEQLELEHEKATRASREELQTVRSDLMDAARFAMLGELAAGIAHELNNPVAAIIRAADHVGADTTRLLTSLPGMERAAQAITAAREGKWASPRETRKAVRELAEHLRGDRAKAQTLVSMGVTDPKLAKTLVKNPEKLDTLRAASAIGMSVRDIEVASRRITGLVQSLRSYSRSDANPVDDVQVHEGLEDTLRLAAPRLSGVEIQRHYDPDLPLIRCFPSRLEQVWTNLLINAAEAMKDVTERPVIEITTTRHGDDAIRVKIQDNGPGIEAEILDSIFLPHFTTKQGTVHYGLGMGLGICRQIVEAHGGRITADSNERGACMSVTLPIAGPGEEDLTEYGLHTAAGGNGGNGAGNGAPAAAPGAPEGAAAPAPDSTSQPETGETESTI